MAKAIKAKTSKNSDKAKKVTNTKTSKPLTKKVAADKVLVVKTAKPVEKAIKKPLKIEKGETKSTVAFRPAPTIMAKRNIEDVEEIEEKINKNLKGSSKAQSEAVRLSKKWSLLQDRLKELKAQPYSMSQTYEAKTPILHKVLGWGYILSNQNSRLEVLFHDGIKFLISNYKS